MIKKKKIGLVLALPRRNSSPVFCALLPQVWNSYRCCRFNFLTYFQEEKEDESGWTDPAGFHLIPLPFADDIRAAPIQEGFQGTVFFFGGVVIKSGVD
jgi:ATP-dependent DNA helicase 2 subunit 1